MSQHGDNDDFDWEELRARLQQARDGLRQAGRRSEDRARELMEKRAERIAAHRDDHGSAPTERMLQFTVADRSFALPLSHVHGVDRHKAVTPLPDSPDFVRGVSLVRGSIYELVSLLGFLGEPDPDESAPHVILVGEREARIGLLAGRVESVLEIDRDALLAAPGRDDANAVRGLTDSGTTVLKPDVILSRRRRSRSSASGNH